MSPEPSPGTDLVGAEKVVESAELSAEPVSIMLPIGHAVGAFYRPGTAPGDAPHLVRLGASFHELTNNQFAVWTLAHGSADAVRTNHPWQRRSVEELGRYGGIADVTSTIDGLLAAGLLVEACAQPDLAADFAKSHRLMPLMLGLGLSNDEQGMFDIGFPGQTFVEVGAAVYDLWQWSSMDDTLWGTCQSAAEAAGRAGVVDTELTDAAQMLGGLLGALHVLLLSHAAYLDLDFRLRHPS